VDLQNHLHTWAQGGHWDPHHLPLLADVVVVAVAFASDASFEADVEEKVERIDLV
jgi:hypothetical protein